MQNTCVDSATLHQMQTETKTKNKKYTTKPITIIIHKFKHFITQYSFLWSQKFQSFPF